MHWSWTTRTPIRGFCWDAPISCPISRAWPERRWRTLCGSIRRWSRSIHNWHRPWPRLGESARAEEVFTWGVEKNRLRTPPAKGIHIAYGLFLAGLDRGGGELRAIQSGDPVRPSRSGSALRTRQGALPDETLCRSRAGCGPGGDSGPLRLSNPLSSGPHLHGLGAIPAKLRNTPETPSTWNSSERWAIDLSLIPKQCDLDDIN